eukprot:6491279-Amphidinium_carterae.3
MGVSLCGLTHCSRQCPEVREEQTCTFATMKQMCIVICPMTRVTSFHPEIASPSPVTVKIELSKCRLRHCLDYNVLADVIGHTLTAAPVSMMVDQKSFKRRGECRSM